METANPKVLLLCENESAAQLDRRALRDIGFPVWKIMHSGIEAAKLLADTEEKTEKPEIIVCDAKLNDLDGEQFCAIIRQHPLLLGFPVLLVLPSDSDAEQLQTLGCGASSLLGRPYSLDTLKARMNLLKATLPLRKILKKGANEIDTSAFDTALATYGVLLKPTRDPEDYFRVGMRCLEEHRWNLAISAFEHALRHAQVKAEAELGMAAAFKGKGDQQKMREWLGKAATTFVTAQRWHHARAAYGKLLRHDPEAKNPFIAEAHKQIRIRNYDAAARILAQGAEVLPAESAGDRYAQLCYAAEEPEAMLAALENSFLKNRLDAGEALSREIRHNLEALNQEKLRRQREKEAERKWQMAQEQKNQEKAPLNLSGKPVEVAYEPAINLFEEAQNDVDYAENEDEEQQEGQTLPSLSEQEATTELFEKKPKLNELLSVMKLTWKLARKK